MTNELLPCPFCGGTQDENGIIDHDEKCFVYLLIDALMYGTGSKKKIEKAWNTRAERTCRIEKYRGEWICTACGCTVGSDDPSSELYIDGNAVELWNHCPNCGARRVRKEAMSRRTRNPGEGVMQNERVHH